MEFRSDVTVQLMQHMGGDHSVIASAKVSTQGVDSIDVFEEDDPGSSEGLIRYLMKNRHGTPFEHGNMTFFVHAPIFVFREWHRHRIGVSINEESGRYRDLEGVFYVPANDRGGEMQVPGGKPGEYVYRDGSLDERVMIRESLQYANQIAYEQYEKMLSMGVAREVARMCLPVNIYSSMWWTCNPRSLMAFLSLRTKRDEWQYGPIEHYKGELSWEDVDQAGRAKFPSKPQREIEMGADLMEAFMQELYPLTYKAFNDFGRVCP